ncbi:FUSC family protein [Novosphingobium mangrovi (ex Huang et al. 2023)]|uniref:FUSC family protein n=1 Tax=Novosphingobium mangrovi (ex Huang et al. 2023) TaxID=2976432 RepID=A0ABT2I1M2_9SPHN|nr:FUSC family protein [Novosphingobium mangrovi (ex Huang et al. 2023)]MCT2398695.1 FUSC family protein [Novosphingobium mangrovi (ex Huang et al. 2023)]
MTSRFGLPAALFSLKIYLSAMLAFYVALRIGLPRPYWAILTSFIIAQPLAGAVLSKAFFRIIGTIAGAAATVIMVPPLSNAPELLSLAIALWLALCVFISLLERTPRAYIFVLAGYSACLIAFPSVETPGEIFNVAILRVQEITVGILCGSLVHGVVLPGSVTDMLLRRVDTTLRDAERWSHDSISTEDVPNLDAERRRLALDITEMHQLSIHLPFDTVRAAPRIRTVRALQDQLSQILPLAAGVDDRIKALAERGRPLPQNVDRLIADCRAWLAHPGEDRDERHRQAEALRQRAAALEPHVESGMGWDAALLLNLLARLSSLIAAHRDCRDLRDQMVSPTSRPVSPRVAELLEGRSQRTLHRDVAGAARAAFSAALTVIVGCALWIGSGWQDGWMAVMLAGVFLALFASADDPVAPIRFFLTGTLIAIVIGGVYAFVILPRLDGFPMLAAALAPGLLIGGAAMSSPRHAPVALAAMLGLGSPSLLAVQYNGDFATFANEAFAQLVGILFALVMVRLLQSAGLDGAIRRTLKAGWADIATRSSLNTPPNVTAWISRMLDRIGLLAPRLAMRGDDPGQPLYDALRDVRTGIVIGELRQMRLDLPKEDGAAITPVLKDIGDYYRAMEPDRPPASPPEMLARIDHAVARLADHSSEQVRRAGVLALVSLRRNIFPDAPAYQTPTGGAPA